MNKSFAIRFLLAAMMALSVAVTGCSDDNPPPAGTGGSGGMGTGGGGGDGGMGGTPVPLSVSADPAGTTFTTATISVELTASGVGSDTATIYYTTDLSPVEPPSGAGGAGGMGGMGGMGGAVTSSTMEYTPGTPITIDATTVLKFLAVAADDTETGEELEGYTLIPADMTVQWEQWAQSGHGDIVAAPWRRWDATGEVRDFSDPDDALCAKCHSAAEVEGPPLALRGFLEYAETGDNADPGPLPLGLACVACHSTNTTYPYVLDEAAPFNAVVFPSGLSASYGNGNVSNICMTCHQGLESKIQVDDTIAASAGPYEFVNIHYYAAGATLFGTAVKGGYEYDFQPGAGGAGGAPTYAGQNEFGVHAFQTASENLVDCVGCHMNADAADDQNHTFLPKVTDCNGCHDGDTFPTLEDSPMDNYDAIQALLPALLTAIEAYANDVITKPIFYDPIPYPYFFNVGGAAAFPNRYVDFDATLLRAAYNYQTGQKDPGGYIHNGDYIQQLLYDSIVDLGGTPPSGATRPQ